MDLLRHHDVIITSSSTPRCPIANFRIVPSKRRKLPPGVQLPTHLSFPLITFLLLPTIVRFATQLLQGKNRTYTHITASNPKACIKRPPNGCETVTHPTHRVHYTTLNYTTRYLVVVALAVNSYDYIVKISRSLVHQSRCL